MSIEELENLVLMCVSLNGINQDEIENLYNRIEAEKQDAVNRAILDFADEIAEYREINLSK